jgi:nitroreductase
MRLRFDEVVYTTRAMRRLLPDPVPQELLSHIVEAATMGPCGNHVENWRFYVLTDRARIAQLAELWARIFDRVKNQTGSMPAALRRSCEYMIEHFAEVPAVILPGAVGFPGPGANVVETVTWYASILPGRAEPHAGRPGPRARRDVDHPAARRPRCPSWSRRSGR